MDTVHSLGQHRQLHICDAVRVFPHQLNKHKSSQASQSLGENILLVDSDILRVCVVRGCTLQFHAGNNRLHARNTLAMVVRKRVFRDVPHSPLCEQATSHFHTGGVQEVLACDSGLLVCYTNADKIKFRS